eukprot:CAMPEP_0183467344 /NCGR_PEP_ID=MMETSP0370-20130417/150702_1 /TAXON_ID=268820 /ORGANISM="Peridinium aciculiferum, Strain PAER-2" /LENGTH=116 /DNA_ID=CAMNT_0025659679 /DNA_START=40 /DNA_END=391 /DNA_ORIENTATION=+
MNRRATTASAPVTANLITLVLRDLLLRCVATIHALVAATHAACGRAKGQEPQANNVLHVGHLQLGCGNRPRPRSVELQAGQRQARQQAQGHDPGGGRAPGQRPGLRWAHRGRLGVW